MIIVDPELRIVHAEGVGFEPPIAALARWPGRLLSTVLPTDDLALLEPSYRAALNGEPQSCEYSPSAGMGVFAVQITPVRDSGGAVASLVFTFEDIRERVFAAEALSRSEACLRESERLIGVGSWELVPTTGSITYSEGFARLMGLSHGAPLELPGFLSRVHDEDHDAITEAIATCLATGSATCEFRAVGIDTTVSTFAARAEAIRPLAGEPTCLRGVLLDVTEARAADRERLAAIELFQQGFDGAPIGMALIDAAGERYVRVNDAMCRLLDRPREQLVGATINSVTHPDDQEFNERGRRTELDGSMPNFTGEKRYLLPDGGVVWATVHVAAIRHADGSLLTRFSQVVDITERKAREALFEQSVSDASWLGRIRDAIDDDRLVLYRQPIVDLRTGETVQQELLLRMRGEDGAIIAPGEFLPIAERYGLIAEIDRWVVRQAVELAARGEATEFNLSGASIGDPFILRVLASAIEETGADPALLVVEVTETAMVNQLDAGRQFAEGVAALGCQLALDDFGTGFASLSYLKRIPAQHLKIDIEFVRDLARSETDERLVRGIVGMAREFNQTTIAEGIENEATLVRLRELGVHRGQGYLLGRPGPVASVVSTAAPARSPAARRPRESAPVSVVTRAFAAFAERDVDALLKLCHVDVVLRPFRETSALTGREAPYRGHDGIRAYFRDVAEVWESLKLTPTAFRPDDASVIVFGRAESSSGGPTKTLDMLWVWRLRDGLIASVEVFHSAPDALARARTPQFAREPAPEDPAGDERLPTARATMALADRFSETLRVGCSAEAERVMDDALAAGMAPAAVHTLVIEPAMAHIGELWETDAISVAGEHLATAISHRMLDRLLKALTVARPRSRELVLLAAVEGQRHVLGLRMVADVLEVAGFDVLFLGADVPLGDLRDFVAEREPSVVGLSYGVGSDVSQLARAICAIHEVSSEPRIMLGGRAVPPGLRDIGYPFVAGSVDVLQTVQQLLDGPPQTLPPVMASLVPALDRSAPRARSVREGVRRREVAATPQTPLLASATRSRQSRRRRPPARESPASERASVADDHAAAADEAG